MNKDIKYYSESEERINVWSHFVGFAMGVIGLILLIIKSTAQDGYKHLVVYLIYGSCILALFAASTLYHNSKDEVKRKRLKVFDHCAIYLLIAGSYIPFIVLAMDNKWGYIILTIVWLLAIAGIILKLFFTGRFKLLSTISYVLLGWIVVIAVKPLMDALSTPALIWLAAGGVFYTIGAVLYSIKRIPYNHAIFHVFVLAGAFSHFWAVYNYV